MTIIENVIKVYQGESEFYLFVIPFKHLMKHATVDYFDDKADKGYQRRPSRGRVRDAMEFITKKSDSSFPLTIVVNVRAPDKLEYDEEEKTLFIPDKEKMYIIDGQHRYEALKLAFEEDFPVGNFQVPISLFTHTHWLNEALEFLTINRSAKAVRTDLAERIIAQAKKDRGFKEKLDKESLGPMKKIIKGSENIEKLIYIVNKLTDDKTSFWFGKIKKPNVESTRGTTVSERAFTQSLQELSKSPAFHELNLDIIILALKNFWRAIAELCPESSAIENKSVLLKTTGVYTLNQIFSRLLGKIRVQRGRYVLTTEVFKEYLQRAGEWMSDKAWEKDGKISLYGTGAKSFSLITKIIMDEIEYNSPKEEYRDGIGDVEI
ncbi:MAG: DGQHR domain-containing protein [Candidatus Heimdallarchaeaceae archaeon]